MGSSHIWEHSDIASLLQRRKKIERDLALGDWGDGDSINRHGRPKRKNGKYAGDNGFRVDSWDVRHPQTSTRGCPGWLAALVGWQSADFKSALISGPNPNSTTY